ncbi:VWA domain-containing protein [candidate division KSB1 bacterium]|nr:VWA domain-containing protein [candidate division KSB1 bacterium]
MIKFEYPWLLWMLLLLPLWLGLIWYGLRQRRKASELFVADGLLAKIAYAFSPARLRIKAGMWAAAWALSVIGLANPQVGTKLEEVKRQGIDIVIALDISTSMLCEDIRPSRLESARNEILKFVSGLKGDRVGLVAFAGSAITHCPLTMDYGAVKMLVRIMNTEIIPEQGTVITEALEQATRAFDEEEAKSRVVVVITDGEDQEEEAVEAARKAAEAGIRVYAIGLGTPQGAPIPLRDERGLPAGFKRNPQGEVIVTRLNEPLLERVADAGDGRYLRGSQSAQELQTIWDDIAQMEKTEFGKKQFTSFEDRFAYLVLPALLLLLGEFFVSERKREERWRVVLPKFRRGRKLAGDA